MSHLSRRQLITTGPAAMDDPSEVADRYGLIPPDHGGLYGAGASLTYAAQRLLTRHSLAREFPRSQISKAPFPNGGPPRDEAYQRLQAGGVAGWRRAGDGMGPRPPPLPPP